MVLSVKLPNFQKKKKKIGIFSKVGGTMNHSTLVSCGSRLKSVLMTLERERNPKPQTIVLIGNFLFPYYSLFCFIWHFSYFLFSLFFFNRKRHFGFGCPSFFP